MQIYRLKGRELNDFINDPAFKNIKHLPISRHRAVSHISNPRKGDDDIILYIAQEGDQLIAYRTVYADYLYIGKNTIKAGWLSGNWVIPGKRRQGIASKLLQAALNDWDNSIIFTNYAPESKAVYDKSGQFELVKSKNGIRGYMRFYLHYLLPPKSAFFKKIKGLLKFLDLVLNIFADSRILILRAFRKTRQVQLEFLYHIDKESEVFIREWKQKELTRRNGDEMNYILQYPWVINAFMRDDVNSKYHFSALASPFFCIYLKIYDNNSQMIGFLMLTIKSKELKIPYLYYNVENESLIGGVITELMIRKKLNMCTIYHEAMAAYLRTHRTPFLWKKNIQQNYYATRPVADVFFKSAGKDQIIFQDGDGDPAFV